MKKAFPFILLSLLFAFTALEAQITIESITTSDGFMGMGASVSTEKSYTQGDARREESNVKFTGGIMKHMSPKETQIEITRLDKEVIWQMNDKDKKYTEMTFAEFKKMMEEGLLNQPMTGKPERASRRKSRRASRNMSGRPRSSRPGISAKRKRSTALTASTIWSPSPPSASSSPPASSIPCCSRRTCGTASALPLR